MTMFYTLTRPSDTWDKIARSYYGSQYTSEDMQHLLSANKESMDYYWPTTPIRMGNQYDIYCHLPEYRAIWFPPKYCATYAHHRPVLRQLDSAPLHSRQMLALLGQNNVNPHYALAAVMVAEQTQSKLAQNSPQEPSTASRTAKPASFALASKSIERVGESFDKFVESIQHLNHVGNTLRLATNPIAAKAELKTAYTEASRLANQLVAKVATQLTNFTLDSQKNLIRGARGAHYFPNRMFSVTSGDMMDDLLHMTKCFRVSKFLPGGLEIAIDLGQVGATYEQGGDWMRELSGVLGGTTAGIAVDAGLLFLTSTGVGSAEIGLGLGGTAALMGSEALAGPIGWVLIIVEAAIIGWWVVFGEERAKKGYDAVQSIGR